MALTLEQIKNETWAIKDASCLEDLARTVAHRATYSAADVEAYHRRDLESRVQRQGDAGLVHVRGVLVRGNADPYLNWRRHRNTGFDDVREQLQAALGDPAVKTIALVIDSPGGVAAGLDQLAGEIREASKTKPVTAYVSGMAASAAYYLASAADRIVSEKDAVVGSIGTYGVVTDLSGMAEANGIKVHVVRSGPFKGTGTPGAPVTDEQLAEIQQRVDAFAQAFTAQVASGRRLPLARAKTLATGQAWIATEAKDLGLVDDFGHLGTAAGGPSTPTFGLKAEKESTVDNDETKVEPQAATVKQLRAKFGDEPEFCLEEAEAGASMDQAERAYDKLKLKQAQARAEAAEKRADELQAKVGELEANQKPKVLRGGGVDPETLASEGGPKDEDEVRDFHAEAKARAKAEGITYGQAASALAKEEPELHAAWVAAQKPRTHRRRG